MQNVITNKYSFKKSERYINCINFLFIVSMRYSSKNATLMSIKIAFLIKN